MGLVISKLGLRDQQDDQPSSSLLIIPKEKIAILRLIGSGNFGVVHEISWKKNGVKRIYASKTLLDLKNAHILMKEFYNMVQLNNDNVVKLLGISLDERAMSLIMEFCDGGSLKSRLDDHHKPKILVTILKDYAYQIANGMNYLTDHRVLHNDLAARNILLTNKEQTVKIGDFGLARIIDDNEQYYFKRSSTPVAKAWTAPEVLLEMKYTILSDVYSYGVVLWEMFSYGAMPSQMNHSNENPFLEQPEACPDDFYALMKKCWSFDSHSRPEFAEIKNYLSKLKIAIMGVSNDYCGEHFQNGDNIIAIRDKGENRIFCQNVRSHQFGIIGAEKLVAVSATENISESSRLIRTRIEAFELEASRIDTSTSFLNRLFTFISSLNRIKWLITLGILCSLLFVIILALWYTTVSDVETTTYILPTTTYIVPTEVISTTTQTKVNPSDTCDLPKAVGPCAGKNKRYFYSQSTKQCTEFEYSGCAGNSNNFKTLEECKSRCLNNCPFGWYYYNTTRKCFYIESNSISWDAAKNVCAQKGGYLASIENSGENEFVASLAKRHVVGLFHVTWIGLRRINNDSSFVDGSKSSFLKSSRDPQPAFVPTTDTNCYILYLSIYDDIAWKAVNCESTKFKDGFVCSIKLK